MAEVLEGEYKGNKMLIIRRTPEDKFPFQFGIRKAQLILEHVEDIRQFVEKYGES